MNSSRRQAGKSLTALALGLTAMGFASLAQAADTIKVGVLHSLSGTMAISETVLKDTVLMAIDEINAKGGLLGKKLEPVVVDPASNWPLFAEKAKQLIGQDKVVVTFGCWTSVSRKSVLPVYDDGFELLAEQAALGVDLVDGHQHGVFQHGFRNRHRAGQAVQDADLDGVISSVGR